MKRDVDPNAARPITADETRETARHWHAIADAAQFAMCTMSLQGFGPEKVDEARSIADRARHLGCDLDDWANHLERGGWRPV